MVCVDTGSGLMVNRCQFDRYHIPNNHLVHTLPVMFLAVLSDYLYFGLWTQLFQGHTKMAY